MDPAYRESAIVPSSLWRLRSHRIPLNGTRKEINLFQKIRHENDNEFHELKIKKPILLLFPVHDRIIIFNTQHDIRKYFQLFFFFRTQLATEFQDRKIS